jgi:hypothetical protein
MKKTALLLMTLATTSFTVQADDKMDWKACEKETKEFQCSGDDKAIWSCLEKHDDKLSPACQKTHEKGDAKFKK